MLSIIPTLMVLSFFFNSRILHTGILQTGPNQFVENQKQNQDNTGRFGMKNLPYEKNVFFLPKRLCRNVLFPSIYHVKECKTHLHFGMIHFAIFNNFAFFVDHCIRKHELVSGQENSLAIDVNIIPVQCLRECLGHKSCQPGKTTKKFHFYYQPSCKWL